MPTTTVYGNHEFRDEVTFSGQVNLPNVSIGNSQFSSSPANRLDRSKVVHQFSRGYAQRAVRRHAVSIPFDLDNNTTTDDVLLRPARAITILAARIIYTDATTGTVAGGSAKIGTTVGGAEIVAATNYEDTKAVGTATAMTLTTASGVEVAAGTPVIVRHTGVASTQAGMAKVEIEYVEDDSADLFEESVVLYACYGTSGVIVAFEAFALTAATSAAEVEIDLQLGNEDTGYATVLSAPITLDNSIAAREVVAAALAATTLAAGDQLKAIVTITNAGGTLPTGLALNLVVAEAPS